MHSTQEKIKVLKEQLIQEIINDDSFTKLEKLKLLSDEQLFKIESFIQDDEILIEWQDELIEKIKTEGKTSHPMVDSFISPSEHDFERHTVFYLHDIVYLLERLIKHNDKAYVGNVLDYSKPLPVVTARNSKLTINKTPSEVIDKVYDWAIDNKTCGYKIDW